MKLSQRLMYQATLTIASWSALLIYCIDVNVSPIQELKHFTTYNSLKPGINCRQQLKPKSRQWHGENQLHLAQHRETLVNIFHIFQKRALLLLN